MNTTEHHQFTTTDMSTSTTDNEWKLNFISEKSKNFYLQLISQAQQLIVECENNVTNRLETLQSLKSILSQIRDKVIGNNCCKYFFMRNDILQILIPLLWMRDESNAEFTRTVHECQKDALTLFSVLICQNGLIQWSDISAMNVFSNLLMLLQGTAEKDVIGNSKFFEILTKSLVCFVKKMENTRDSTFQPNNLNVFFNLLNPKNSSPAISQHVAIIISTSCDTLAKQNQLIELKCPDLLLEMMNSICYIDELSRLTIKDTKTLDGIIDLLCTLTRDNSDVSRTLSSTQLHSRRTVSVLLFQLLSLSSISTELKLKISLLSIHLYRADSSKSLSFEAQSIMLAFLVSLMDSADEFSSRSSFLLAFLVSEDASLQAAAIQMNVINILLKNLERAKSMDSLYYEKRLDCALIVASALSSINEDNRKQIVESKFLGLIVECMSSENSNLRVSACQCARNLSRSVKNLRTNLFDAGIAKPLLKLLNDSSNIVQVTACATICNMVLDFTPIKKVIVNENIVPELVKLVTNSDISLRINVIWLLKNLLYHSDNEIRGKVLAFLNFDIINNLLQENNELIREQTLNLIRNIGCGRQENIEEVFNGFGSAHFIEILESNIQKIESHQIILQTLYIIVNIATGSELHKSRIMESTILLQNILNFLAHDNPKIRLASIWSLINLTWPNEPGFIERSSFLIQMGALKVLKSLQNDPDYDVRQKVNCALANFSAAQ